MDDTNNLLNHRYYTEEATTPSKEASSVSNIVNRTVSSYDVLIFKIPQAWYKKWSAFRKEVLLETIHHTNEVYGAKTIVIYNLQMTNSIYNNEDLQALNETNAMVRDVVNHWDEYLASSLRRKVYRTVTVENVLMLDFASFQEQIIELNAKSFGFDTTQSNYTLHRFYCGNTTEMSYPPSIAQVCAESYVEKRDCPSDCTRNMISKDGLHWCTETMGGRTIAGIGCLVRCSISMNERYGTDKRRPGWATSSKNPKFRALQQCEARCHDRFMSTKPVEEIRKEMEREKEENVVI